MSFTASDVLADVSNGLAATPRTYYASSEEGLFYLITQGGGEWVAQPISDERHDLLLDLKDGGKLLEEEPITVMYRDGFRLEVRTLRPVA